MENSIALTPIHRVLMIILIITEHIAYIWAMILYINYNSIRIPYVDYPSVVPPTEES
jgi:hypothetical protein